jgi:hypothetical protein
MDRRAGADSDETLRMMHMVEAGGADCIWSLEEIVGLSEAT